MVIWTVIFGVAFAFFKIQNKVMKGGIRPDRAEMEMAGLDLPEMGVLAYPEFVGSHVPGLEDEQVADRGGHRAERVARHLQQFPRARGAGSGPHPSSHVTPRRRRSRSRPPWTSPSS